MSGVEKMLQDMAENFCHKIPDVLSLIVQIDIQPAQQLWHVIVEPGKRVTVGPGSDARARFVLTTTEETLHRIYTGQMTALTAAGRASMSDPALLDFKMGKGLKLTPEIHTELLAFIQRFFNCSDPERILLGEVHARVVHGGHAIPLYYHPGLRSAWYLVKKDDRLNEPGDTNPFPQAFVFISGQGFAKIGDKTIKVRAGESYYIPPGSDHVVWTENDEPLVLIFLAWGEGA